MSTESILGLGMILEPAECVFIDDASIARVFE